MSANFMTSASQIINSNAQAAEDARIDQLAGQAQMVNSAIANVVNRGMDAPLHRARNAALRAGARVPVTSVI